MCTWGIIPSDSLDVRRASRMFLSVAGRSGGASASSLKFAPPTARCARPSMQRFVWLLGLLSMFHAAAGAPGIYKPRAPSSTAHQAQAALAVGEAAI